MLVDTHCHLDTERFDDDREEVIARARAAGICWMVNIGCDVASSARSLALAAAHDDIFASVGIHPHEADKAPGNFDDELVRMSAHERCVAVGETGLDYWYDLSQRGVQRDVFARHVAVARRVRKPIVLHIRNGKNVEDDAFADAVDLLRSEGACDVGGVFHCFTGTVAQARIALDLGFYVSIPGVVTFKNAGELPEVVRFAPLDRLVVETDAPYMAPTPHRGKRNEPAFVAHTAACVAQLREISDAEMQEATSANAGRLFGRPPTP